MTRSIVLTPLAPMMLLAACNSSPTVTATNATGSEVEAKVAAAGGAGAFMAPGRWEGAMTMAAMDMPGMEKLPPEMLAKMKAKMSQPHPFTTCLTPEEAKQPKGRFFGGEEKTCTYDHFTMGGGTIDAAMTCATGGVKRTMTMTGTYSPDAYDMTMSSQGTGEGPMGGSMKMSIAAKRAGECTGKEDG